MQILAARVGHPLLEKPREQQEAVKIPKALSENSLQADYCCGGGAEQVILIHQRADPVLVGGPPAVTACAIMQTHDTCTHYIVRVVPMPPRLRGLSRRRGVTHEMKERVGRASRDGRRVQETAARM